MNHPAHLTTYPFTLTNTHESTGYRSLTTLMDTSIETRRYKATAMTKDRLPTIQYNMYNKVEFLAGWRQLVEFYGCEDNLKLEEMPTEYDVETWRRGHSSANVLLQSHLIDSVYQNITRNSGDSPYVKWKELEAIFLNRQDTEVLTNAQTALITCKQGPEQSILEHTGNFNKAMRLLRDLKDTHVEDGNYVLCLFKQSLNLVYTEVLRPVEITNPTITYDEARQELLSLELAGKVFTVVNSPGANVASSAPVVKSNINYGPRQQHQLGKSHKGKERQQGRSSNIQCYKCNEYGHVQADCESRQQSTNQVEQEKRSPYYKGYCCNCGKYGHHGNNCNKKKKQWQKPKKANYVANAYQMQEEPAISLIAEVPWPAQMWQQLMHGAGFTNDAEFREFFIEQAYQRFIMIDCHLKRVTVNTVRTITWMIMRKT